MNEDQARSDGPGVLRKRLREIELFASVTDATLDRIAQVAQVRSYEAGEHVLLEGEPSQAIYFVLQGTVRVYRVSMEGREQVLTRVEPGQTFNTVPPFQDEGRNPANAVTATPVILGILLQDDFMRLVATCPDFALAILRDFAGRLAALTDLVEGLALYTVQERLARFLLEHAGDQEGSDAGEGARESWTQQDIATHLGTVRDVVGRTLRGFEDAGLIRVQRARILLLDRERLEHLAGYR